MREVFQTLYDSYGELFAPMRRINGEPKDKRAERIKRALTTWSGVLSTLSDQQVRIGVTRCIREVPFASKITPADITTRAHAEPQHLGFACVDDAFIECAKNRGVDESERVWSSGLVAHAFNECTTWVWTRLSEKEQRAKFKQHYMYLFNALINSGNQDMAIPKALSAPTVSLDKVRSYDMARMVGEDESRMIIDKANQATGMEDVRAMMRRHRQPNSKAKEVRS